MQQDTETKFDCCPPFDPAPWDDRMVDWHDKKFVQDKVATFLHMPLNFGGTIRRLDRKIREAGATVPDNLGLSDHVSFSSGTIFTGEFDNASFERITAFSVVHLLEDSDRAIGRIHELLRPGGLFIQVTACFREKMTLKTRLGLVLTLLMKRLGVIPLHLNMFSIEDVEKLVESRGFQIVASERIVDGMTACFLVARK